MRSKLTPHIILEGTRLTHKTDIAFALNEHPRIVGPRRYTYHSPLISGEWCGFTPFPWGRGPINFAPEEEARALEVFATWARLFELMPHYSWIIDRFHVSARGHQLAERGVDYDFRWLEDRLRPVGFHLVLCVRRPETFEAARTERLRVSGKPSQYDDLSLFIREQELLRRLCRESSLPVLELDVSDDDVRGACERIADWMAETGGLWAPAAWEEETAGTATTSVTPQADRPLALDSERAGDGETMLCSGCGQELGYDREDEPNGDGPGRHLCGECNRARNFDAELEMMWRNGDL